MNFRKLLSLTAAILLPLLFIALTLFSAAQAAAQPVASPAAVEAAQAGATTLTVTIRSAPYAPLDQVNPTSASNPHLMLLQADVSNTGPQTATDVLLALDYDDETNGWYLPPGENPLRSLEELAPNAHGYAYWFATYPSSHTPPETRTYTVTASAANATPVSTSTNAYSSFLPPGVTLQTAGFNGTGNNQTINSTANVAVGALFTATVTHDLGNDPVSVIFSPVGNRSFDATTMQLVDADITFLDPVGNVSVPDRTFIDLVPALPSGNKPVMVEATYTFLPQRPGQTTLCPYAAILYGTTHKYDNNFCENFGAVTIDATLSLSMTATVDRLAVQQGQLLNYTLVYTNSAVAVNNAWIWSEIDPNLGSIVNVDPAGNATYTTDSRAAWSLGMIDPGITGTLHFQVLVDGNGADIADATDIIADSYFGIELGGTLPSTPALTRTLTTTVQAPSLTIAKSDGQLAAEPLDDLTYTLSLTNNGSISATNVVISDVLPAGVVYSGGAGETGGSGDTLVWSDKSPIAAGEVVTLGVPVSIPGTTPNGTVLTNTALVGYENGAGWRYAVPMASDTTTVNAPVLSIAKSAPDAALTARPLTYTLTYSNDGPAPATSVVITDNVPANTSYLACAGAPCTEAGGTVTWTVGSVPANSSGEVTLTVLVDDALPTGAFVTNDDYGLSADQSAFTGGPAASTEIFRSAAFFDGYAFVDLDADGVFDAGESPLAGVTFTLTQAMTPTVVTGADGYYWFRVEQQGPVTVNGSLPAGFVRTTPASVPASATYGVTQTIDFGYAEEAAAPAVVTGLVYDDEDGNGARDATEQGIAGVAVSLDGTAATTDLFGRYTISTTLPGDYSVVETDPPGYVSTTPNTVNLTVAAGATYPVDFGDRLAEGSTAIIYGAVFADLDGDGLQGPGELGLENVQLTLDGGITATTGIYGQYAFVTTAGYHTVLETDPAGYFSTTPNSVNVNVATGGSAQVNFGDAPDSAGFATIYGSVFVDADGNGLQDLGELGLAGVQLTLDGAFTATTGAHGAFAFAVDPGIHTVVETDPDGYISTTPNSVNVEAVATGASYQVDFGDAPGSVEFATIVGTVFDDADGDGLQGAGELGIPGVTVTLDGGQTALTGPYGGYSFLTTANEVHRLVETDPAGYISTTPNEVFVEVVSGSYRVDFGDILASSNRSALYGTVYHDANRSGARDPGETGIPGVTVTLDGSASRLTDAYGRYTFAIAQAGAHTVVETDPPGYASSTNNEVTVTLGLGEDVQVDFGDYALCEPDAYEEDDAYTAARALLPGSVQPHNFCDDPGDWLRFDAVAGAEYRLTTSASGARADTVLTLFAPDGATFLAGNDDYAGADDFSSQLVWTAPATGQYFLRVSNRADLTGFDTAYELALEETLDEGNYLYLPLIRTAPQTALAPFTGLGARRAALGRAADPAPTAPDGEIVHSCPDPYEVDDSWLLARPIQPGVAEVHSFDSDPSLYAADKDFFSFVLTPLGTFSASVTPAPGTATLLELYDESGNSLGVSGATSLSWDGPPGQYYLGVSSPSGDFFGCTEPAGYTFQAELTGSQLFLPMIYAAAPASP